MPVLFHLVGVLLDLLIQIATLGSAAALVALVVRDGPLADIGAFLLFLALTAGGLTLLTRRIRQRRRTVSIVRGGSEEVSTITWLHFVVDALWIALAIAMVHGAQLPTWDTGTRAGTIAILVLSVALCALRLTVRIRDTPG